MRIDKKKFPVLFKLKHDSDFNKLRINIPEAFKKDWSDTFEKIINPLTEDALNNINYITRPVLEAFDYGSQKTIDRLLSLRNEIKTISRCVLYNAWHDVYECAIYHFNVEESQTNFFILTFPCKKSHHTEFQSDIVGTFVAGLFKHEWEQSNMFGISKASFFTHPQFFKYTEEHAVNLAELYVQCEVFLQYADLEVKNIKTHGTVKEGVRCLYENKLPFPVNIIDSTWYTTLVKSDSFKVRGHFRLQPYGEGLSKRKLVWINDFQKEGYTRKAKISDDNTTE